MQPSIFKLPGIGPKTSQKLAKLGIFTDIDLLNHIPTRYIDFSHTTTISTADLNQNLTITGKINSFNNIYTRYGKNIQKAIVSDTTGKISLIWFNQPYLAQSLKVGDTYKFAGKISEYQGAKTIIAPQFGDHNTGKIIPIYPETHGLSSKWFRKIISQNISQLLPQIIENLPNSILKKYKLMPLDLAYSEVHLPTKEKLLQKARQRLAIQELLSLQSYSLIQKQKWSLNQPLHTLKISPSISQKIKKLIDSLPFKLTTSQVKVWHQTLKDLVNPDTPGNRLIQGDVGSGKTIIALLATYFTSLNKFLTIYLAPTEILAKQHYQTFNSILTKHPQIRIKLLTSSNKITDKDLKNTDILICTHAVLFRSSTLAQKIGLLIIDEQHKFGVKQRSRLTDPLHPPHTITMTATPIPRTISLTYLGNLSLSTIDQLPSGRLPVKTFLVPNSKKSQCYQWIKTEIKKNHVQSYIVCPFIEESDINLEVKAATQEFEFLSQNIFPDLKLALIHGKTKNSQDLIEKFKNKKIDILVTTPIIEVGIDIPNSTIMIIQSAERFGLAQLHQLRGRVGRGSTQSYCYLFTQSIDPKTLNRLKFFQQHPSGSDIAEYDLSLRGPGEIFSELQHGHPSLKLADLQNSQLIETSQQILKDITRQNPKFNLSQLLNPHLSKQLKISSLTSLAQN